MATFNLGSPLSIATQGLLSNNALTIATQGFLEGQLSDMIFGGTGGQSQTFSVDAATNGLTFGGAGGINNTWIVIAVGGITIGGTADIIIIHVPAVGGDLVSAGAADINITMVAIGQSGFAIAGDAGESLTKAFIAAGGVLLAGTAAAFFIPGGPVVARPGGTAGPRSVMRRPVSPEGFGARKKKWIEPLKALEPKDYWKRIELAIKLAKEREEPKTHEFIGSGSITLKPNGIAAPLFRDQTPEPIPTYDLAPTNDYSIEGLFINDITTDDLVEVEDEMILNDQIAGGDYDLNIGKKKRFVHEPKDTAKLSFGDKAEVEHTDYILDLVKKEDREFILGEQPESDNDNDDDELRLLGVI